MNQRRCYRKLSQPLSMNLRNAILLFALFSVEAIMYTCIVLMSTCILVLLVNTCVCHLYNKFYLLTYQFPKMLLHMDSGQEEEVNRQCLPRLYAQGYICTLCILSCLRPDKLKNTWTVSWVPECKDVFIAKQY